MLFFYTGARNHVLTNTRPSCSKYAPEFFLVLKMVSGLTGSLWKGAKRIISRTPNAVLGKNPALARARQEEASVTDFHASMDVS
jgi:putative component of membrane protein insertase Oxa1/YidC/SpoIIIJ protein YidD